MDAVAGFACVGGAGPAWGGFGEGGYFDRSIRSTHDHAATKKNLTPWVRKPRKLTKIENGCSKKSPSSIRLRSYIPRFDEKTSTFQLKTGSKIKIRGSIPEVQALVGRITALCSSRLGREFIQYLEGAGDKIELSLLKWEERVQVIVDVKNRGHIKRLDVKEAPCEWIAKSDREACDRFLKEIELGTACIRIGADHPQKEAILRAFKEISMRSIGVDFLLKFKALGKPITIEYLAERNHCKIWYIDGISIAIDFDVKGWRFGGLKKQSCEIVPIPIDPKYLLIHELIHAYRFLLREFQQAIDMTQYLAQIVEYSPKEREYKCIIPNIFFSGHGNFEEQQTITGRAQYTENGFRHMFFDSLRWGHDMYEMLTFRRGPYVVEFFTDPCGPDGMFNQVALMILRNELIYAEPILRKAADEEIAIGIKQVERLLLSDDQRRALNIVGEVLDLKHQKRQADAII